MGYGIMPYRVNLARLSSRLENENPRKRSQTRSACRIHAIDFDDDELFFHEIVEELVDKKEAKHKEYGYKYWYAIQGIIEDIGSFMPNSYWSPGSNEVFSHSPHFKLFDIDAPMSIPPSDDFPIVFVLRKEKMTDAIIKKLLNQATDTEGMESAQELEGWFKEAKRYKQDLILYYY